MPKMPDPMTFLKYKLSIFVQCSEGCFYARPIQAYGAKGCWLTSTIFKLLSFRILPDIAGLLAAREATFHLWEIRAVPTGKWEKRLFTEPRSRTNWVPRWGSTVLPPDANTVLKDDCHVMSGCNQTALQHVWVSALQQLFKISIGTYAFARKQPHVLMFITIFKEKSFAIVQAY